MLSKKKLKQALEAPLLRLNIPLQVPAIPIPIEYKEGKQKKYIIKQCSSY